MKILDNWDSPVEGTFQINGKSIKIVEGFGIRTAKDGTTRQLTGGRGVMSIRQWHQYPTILPRELYIDENPESGDKFDTL